MADINFPDEIPSATPTSADLLLFADVSDSGNAKDCPMSDLPISTPTQNALDAKVDKVAGKGLSTEDYTTTEKSKLAGIQAGATANSSDATLLNRANHTGTQTSSTISDFQESVEDIIGTKIIAGANISVAYNDTTGETTITGTGGGGGSSFWTLVPGTPTRTGNTTFTLTDTSNTNKYDLLLSRGVQIRWTESSVQKRAFIVSATYATNTVTVTIVGDTMASIDASSMRYFVNKGQVITFQYPLTTAVGTDVASRFYSDKVYRVYGARAILATAGTTGTLTVDINKNGTTMFTTKPTVASGTNVGADFTADNNTSLAVSDYVSIDIDAIHTTAGSGLQVQLYIGATYDTNLA